MKIGKGKRIKIEKTELQSKNPMLSIIVTIYNKKEYLRKALDSILKQTLSDIEVICIDDGSTDGSAEILDEYKNQDHRIIVVHKENTGQVQARKDGVLMAKADYIGFVDADDWIEYNMYENLMDFALENHLDFVSSGLIEDSGSEILDNEKEGVYSTEEDLRKLYSEFFFSDSRSAPKVYGNAVTKIFRRKILQESCINIDNRIHFREDDAFVYSYMVRCNRIGILHRAFYHYRYLENSDSNKQDDLYLARINYYYNFLRSVFEKSDFSDLLLEQFDKYVAKTVVFGMKYRMGMSMKAFPCVTYPFQQQRNIIVYGAGVNGVKFINRFNKDGKNGKIVAVLDKNWEEKRIPGIEVVPPNDIFKYDYDLIAISIENERIADEIRCSLIEKGVDSDKIIWI